MKNLYNFVKGLVVNIFMLYLYNLVSVNFNLMIPINVFSIAIVCFLGFPGLFTMILFKLLIL